MTLFKIFKWTVYSLIGLLAAACAVFWLYFTIFPVKPPDPFNGHPRDLGRSPGFGDTGMLYINRTMILGETKYEAEIGEYKNDPRSDPPWEGLRIGITKTGAREYNGEIIEVGWPYFSRWFKKAEVPMRLWTDDIEAVVSFDPELREATFSLGFTNITCVLPPADQPEATD